eukprot:1855822-Lingulodinium_polyedra.AAC.1
MRVTSGHQLHAARGRRPCRRFRGLARHLLVGGVRAVPSRWVRRPGRPAPCQEEPFRDRRSLRRPPPLP